MPETAAARLWPLAPRLRYPLITDLALSPDGRRVVYVVREPLLTDAESKFITHLFLADAADGEPRQLTFGDASATAPQWSPDGRCIAFLSDRTGKNNLYVMAADGGEAWNLTRFEKTDVARARWSPDGRQLAFLMAEPPSEEKEKAQKAKDDARVFDVDVDFTQLYLVPFSVAPRPLPEARQLTRGRRQVLDFDWSPDGKLLAFSHQPTPDANAWPASRLATLAVADSAAEPNDRGPLFAWGPRPFFSPDGRWIAVALGDEPARWAVSDRVALFPVAGGAPRPLAVTPDGSASVVGWAADSADVYVVDIAGVGSRLFALPLDGGAPRALTDGGRLALPVACNPAGQMAVVAQDFDQPNGVYLVDAASGDLRLIAQPPLPADWPAAPLPRAEVVRWQAPDGLEVEGVLVAPLDFEQDRHYPLLVCVHGGPAGFFSRTYLGAPGGQFDLVGLAERGYLVLRPNPRGSSGYGKDFRFANYGNWGGGDYADIMAGVDALIERGLADPERLGVGGWSYGGFMTSWIITQTRRFAAACIGAPVTDPLSFNGTSDIPAFIPDYFGAESWEDFAAYQRQSPILHVKGVTTPALIQHGENDIRVPLGQGREFYNALKRQGVPTELVIYPREGHGIAEPRHVLSVAERATAWFERWIPGGGR